MNQAFATLAMLALPAGALAAALPPDAIPPTPIAPGPGQQALVAWRAVAAGCSEGELPLAGVAAPYPQLGWTTMPRGEADYLFSLDAAGRPVDIRHGAAAPFVPQADDLAPALAASRFPAGTPRHDCHIRFAAQATPLPQVSARDAMALSIMENGRQPALRKLAQPAGSTCFEQAPHPLLQAFPDFTHIPRQPGRMSWSTIGFDLSASGRPQAPKLSAGSGNAALDRAARDAVARSRFADGKRTGCLYSYWMSAGAIPAPDMPEKSTVRPDGATCPVDVPWAIQPRMQYPANYRRRGIEGWAVVAFDTAPWGAVGDVRVLAAEPSADFGQAAADMLRSATLPRSDRGYVGCVERVRFVMRNEAKESESAGQS